MDIFFPGWVIHHALKKDNSLSYSLNKFANISPFSTGPKLFVTGGCRGNCCRALRLHVAEPVHDATDQVWCFCPVTRTCTRAPAMQNPRTMHTAVTCLDRVYVIGGRTNGPREGGPSLLEVTSLLYTPRVKISEPWRFHLELTMVLQSDAIEEPFLVPQSTFQTRVL